MNTERETQIPADVADRLERLQRDVARVLACVDVDQLLTEREAAAFRRKSVFALRKERARRAGPPFIKDGSAVRYLRSELLRWLAEHTRETRESERQPRFRSGPNLADDI